jgi:hypothetical protein
VECNDQNDFFIALGFFTQLQELGKHNITLFLWIMVYSRFPFSQDVTE